MKCFDNQFRFNIFSFISTFARSLIEIFISLYLYKNGYTINNLILFYFLINLFGIPLSYIFVKIGEKTKYTYIMLMGLSGFILVQILLQNINTSFEYLLLISLLYSVYKRGYWVARRFYITKVMPTKKTSGLFSIVLVMSQISSILAGYVGSYILSSASTSILMLISSILLFISVIPLFKIKYTNNPDKVKLITYLKKYDKSNYILFSFYELTNLLTYIFPIYIAIYVNNSYSLAGNLNAISNIAIIIFIILYGRIIKNKKNYLILSTILLLTCSLFKLGINDSFIIVIYFIEGLVTKMLNQSVNKIYFENRQNMNLTNYNLIYQIIECLIRTLVCIPLLLINNIKIIIITTISIVFVLMLIYAIMIKNKKIS